MNDPSPPYRNLWALTVLCLLREAPMHPYEMQRLIRQRKKDDFLDLKRGSLYHTISWLEREGLISARETTREGRRPQRTVYQLTAAGAQELVAWLREFLANPTWGVVPFQAGLSFLAHLKPAVVIEQLGVRVGRLEQEIESLNSALRELVPRIGRLLVLESEHSVAMKQAELAWTKSLIESLSRGELVWRPEGFLKHPRPKRG
jgi:DNA-binding PadR family transcriptional regulator